MFIDFDENFQGIIFEIQKKYNEDDSNGSNNTQDDHLHRLDLLEKNSLEKEKKDMWDDWNPWYFTLNFISKIFL